MYMIHMLVVRCTVYTVLCAVCTSQPTAKLCDAPSFFFLFLLFLLLSMYAKELERRWKKKKRKKKPFSEHWYSQFVCKWPMKIVRISWATVLLGIDHRTYNYMHRHHSEVFFIGYKMMKMLSSFISFYFCCNWENETTKRRNEN